MSPLDLSDLCEPMTPAIDAAVAALAARRHILLIGKAGSGKTMLTARLAGCLPAQPAHEARRLEYLRPIFGPRDWHTPEQAAGAEAALLEQAARSAFRAPHHTVSYAGMLGAGGPPSKRPWRPGEVHLAHGGLLMLDEAEQFSPAILEDLSARLSQRPPEIEVAVVLATDPCRCRYRLTCACTSEQRERHMATLDGVVKRLNPVVIQMAQPTVDDLQGPRTRWTTAKALAVVAEARAASEPLAEARS